MQLHVSYPELSLPITMSEIPDLWKRVLSGDKRACARLISLAEDDPESRTLIRELSINNPKKSLRIGITGAPGAGKSCLTSALAQQILSDGFHVGIIAIDPSSPFTGGALLGDRYRMHELIGNQNVFIRSLASRQSRGGLSPATALAADILEAYGSDWILIETVGVGQVELDIMDQTDMVILVLQPQTGDTVQVMKAGVLEIADVFTINKSDLEGAETLLNVLNNMLNFKWEACDPSRPVVVPVQAKNNIGIDSLYIGIKSTVRQLTENGKLSDRKIKRQKQGLDHLILDHFQKELAGFLSEMEEYRMLKSKLEDGQRVDLSLLHQIFDRLSIEKNRNSH